MLDTIRELSKELKLKMLMINSFVPPEELSKIERKASWDDESQEWRISHIQYAGNYMKKARGEIVDLDEDDIATKPVPV
jgi:kinesin family protein 3/17